MVGSRIETIILNAGVARAEIVPALGGGMAGLWVADKPALRPWSGKISDGFFSLAMNVLAPFSNRISGGFEWDGEWIALDPNLKGEAYPIHGDAFERSWHITAHSEHSLNLALPNGAFGPWRYNATLTYLLTPNSLTVTLKIANTAERTLPYGFGFHPWLPRDEKTRLRFFAKGVWHETKDHLPLGNSPIAIPDYWQFKRLKCLPKEWVNNAFTGWNKAAQIKQGRDAVSLHLAADGKLDTAILYSPSGEADYFCFEPVSHPVNALNLCGRPGIVKLAPHGEASASMTMSW